MQVEGDLEIWSSLEVQKNPSVVQSSQREMYFSAADFLVLFHSWHNEVSPRTVLRWPCLPPNIL